MTFREKMKTVTFLIRNWSQQRRNIRRNLKSLRRDLHCQYSKPLPAEISKWTYEQLKDFRNIWKALNASDWQLLREDSESVRNRFLNISFQIIKGPHYLTGIVAREYAYHGWEAHPNEFSKTWVLDQKGRVVCLDDVLSIPEDDAVQEIQKVIRDNCENAAPMLLANFRLRSWYPIIRRISDDYKEGIEVIIDPYEVGSRLDDYGWDGGEAGRQALFVHFPLQVPSITPRVRLWIRLCSITIWVIDKIGLNLFIAGLGDFWTALNTVMLLRP